MQSIEGWVLHTCQMAVGHSVLFVLYADYFVAVQPVNSDIQFDTHVSNQHVLPLLPNCLDVGAHVLATFLGTPMVCVMVRHAA